MKKKLFAVLIVIMVLMTACGGGRDDVIESKVDTTVDIQSKQADELKTAKIDEDEQEEVVDEVESENVEDEAEPETTVESETTGDDEQEKKVSDSENYETLEDYYNESKSDLDALWNSMSEEGLSVAVEVKGNNFLVTIKILDSSMLVDGIAEALEGALEAQADTFKDQAAQLDEGIGAEVGTCAVTMRYTDPNDNVLAEKTYRNDR